MGCGVGCNNIRWTWTHWRCYATWSSLTIEEWNLRTQLELASFLQDISGLNDVHSRTWQGDLKIFVAPVNKSAACFPTNSCMWSGQGLYTMTRSSTISDEGTDHGWNRSCLVCENLGMSEFLGGGSARLAHPKLPTVCWVLYVVGGSLRMRLGISGCNSLLLGREWRPAPTRSCPGTRLFVLSMVGCANFEPRIIWRLGSAAWFFLSLAKGFIHTRAKVSEPPKFTPTCSNYFNSHHNHLCKK